MYTARIHAFFKWLAFGDGMDELVEDEEIIVVDAVGVTVDEIHRAEPRPICSLVVA